MQTLKQMIAHLDYLDRKTAILYRRHKQAAAAAAAYEYEVHKRMRDEGFEEGDAVTHSGTRWGYQVDWYAVVQDPLEFQNWAGGVTDPETGEVVKEAHAPHLLRPQPAKATLNQLVQKHREDGTPLPPGIGASPKMWVSRRSV